MIQRTEWIPDTCNCRFEYEWDDSVAEQDRVHVPRFVQPCQFHITEPTQNESFMKAIEENQLKNNVIRQVFDNFPELQVQDSRGGRAIKEGAVEWSFDDNRNLKFSVPELSKAQLTVLETALVQDAGIDDSKVVLSNEKNVVIEEVLNEPVIEQ